MRPRIVEWLNSLFGTSIFDYLVPEPAMMYAIMLALGLWVFIRRSVKAQLSGYHAAGLALWVSVCGLLGARVFYLVQNLSLLWETPEILWELNGATVSWGVYLGGMIGAAGYSLWYRFAPWRYLDVSATVIGIGPMLGRWACFLNGDDYGTLTSLPWGVRYPQNSYPFYNHAGKGWLIYTEPLSLAVHPVQLYESFAGLVLFIGFSLLWKKYTFKAGALFCLFWIAYPVCRFCIEFFRGDEERGYVGFLSTGQFMSLVLISVAVAVLGIRYQWKVLEDPSALAS